MPKVRRFLERHIPKDWETHWETGLESLDWEPVPPRGQHDVYSPGTILGPFIYIKDKKSGVEPGFEAYVRDGRYEEAVSDIISAAIYSENPKDPIAVRIHRLARRGQLDLSRLRADIDSPVELSQTRKKEINSIYRMIEQDPDCAQFILVELDKLPVGEKLPRYLIKQDYKDPVLTNRVSISKRRAKMTQKAVKARRRFGKLGQNAVAFFHNLNTLKNKNNANRNGFLESLSTRLASVSGMRTQQQGVCRGGYEYPPRRKLLAMTKFQPGFSDFEDRVYGGNLQHGNCLVEVVRDKDGKLQPKKDARGYLRSDHTIKGLGETFAAMVRSGDFDFFGSTGGNKGFVDGKFFGIDFGHAYEGSNTIVRTLQDNCSFTQPSKPIRNASIVSDTLLSEKMKGIYYLCKLRGIPIPEAVINSYDEEFRRKLSTIEKDADLKVFEEYSRKARELEFTAEGKIDPAFKGITEEIEQRRKRMLAADTAILSVFRHRIGLTAAQLNFIDNIEKLCSETSPLSPNAKVKSRQGEVVRLNHLAVNPKHRVVCQLERSSKPDHHVINISAKDRKKAEQLNAQLYAFFKEKFPMYRAKVDPSSSLSLETLKFSYDAHHKSLTMTCNQAQLAELMRFFSEDRIAQYKRQPTLSLERKKRRLQALRAQGMRSGELLFGRSPNDRSKESASLPRQAEQSKPLAPPPPRAV
jgi:hypothetical protein